MDNLFEEEKEDIDSSGIREDNIVSDKPRAIMFSSNSSHPRYHRRASLLLEAGYDVTVYTLKRDLYTQNTFPNSVKVIILDIISHGRYILRFLRLFLIIRKIRKHEKLQFNRPKLIYTFGLDMAWLGCFFKNNSASLVYEVGDLSNPNPKKSIFSRIFVQFEKMILKKIDLLAVTSPSFLTHYYELIEPNIRSKSIVIENKMLPETAKRFKRPQRETFKEPIRIGFIGLLRYEESITALIDAVSRRENRYELHIYGDGFLKEIIQKRAEDIKNVYYHGPFNNPDDLESIYSSIDISYVVYDNSCLNVRLALPNKLYESLFFRVPLIVADRTLLSERVKDLKAGYIVEPQEKGFMERFLDELDIKSISETAHAIANIREEFSVEDRKYLIKTLLNDKIG